jgi:coenzyme F420-reducing hydrogenase gamma subunit
LQKHIYKIWKDADDAGERYLPHEFMYKITFIRRFEEYYEIDLKIAGCMPQQKKFTNYLSRMGR